MAPLLGWCLFVCVWEPLRRTRSDLPPPTNWIHQPQTFDHCGCASYAHSSQSFPFREVYMLIRGHRSCALPPSGAHCLSMDTHILATTCAHRYSLVSGFVQNPQPCSADLQAPHWECIHWGPQCIHWGSNVYLGSPINTLGSPMLTFGSPIYTLGSLMFTVGS
jgi:hypothetical protein